MSSYSRNGTNNGDSSSDRQRGSRYGGGERYIPRDGDDRRDDRRREDSAALPPLRSPTRLQPGFR